MRTIQALSHGEAMQMVRAVQSRLDGERKGAAVAVVDRSAQTAAQTAAAAATKAATAASAAAAAASAAVPAASGAAR